MKTLHVRYSIFLALILSTLLLACTPQPTAASMPMQNAEMQTKAGADIYLVTVTFLNISDINTSAGTFTADFLISFTCKNVPCHYEPNWDVMNAVQDITPIEQQKPIPFSSYDYRLKTTLIGNVDYTYFPFTYICYHVFIQDKQLGNDKITYELNSLQVDKTLFNPAGWHYRPNPNASEIQPISYNSNPTQFDRLDFWIFMERDRLGAFMKTIFAALVIILVGMLSYLLRVEDVKERLALTSSTLVAIVLYHISLITSVPDTGYLSFVDKFMVATYIVIFLSLAVSVLIMVYMNNEQKARAQRLHLLTRWTIPALWLCLMAYVFIYQLIIPYKELLLTGGAM
jgi:hypothetical protein